MSYLVPSEFVTKMVDAGESKIFMSTRDTVIRAYMAGAILALANLAAILWNDADSTRTMTIGGVLLVVGGVVFMLASMNWLGVRHALRETGAIGPIALAILLLVADLMLLSAFIDVAPTLKELMDGVKDLIPFVN